MPVQVAEAARRNNVVGGVGPTVLLRDQMLCGAAEQLRLLGLKAMAERKLFRIVFPHGEATVIAPATLLQESVPAKFLETAWFGHGNSLEINKQIPVDE